MCNKLKLSKPHIQVNKTIYLEKIYFPDVTLVYKADYANQNHIVIASTIQKIQV